MRDHVKISSPLLQLLQRISELEYVLLFANLMFMISGPRGNQEATDYSSNNDLEVKV